jgi:hypothetical protein
MLAAGGIKEGTLEYKIIPMSLPLHLLFLYHFRLVEFSSQIKSKAGNILTKSSSL